MSTFGLFGAVIGGLLMIPLSLALTVPLSQGGDCITNCTDALSDCCSCGSRGSPPAAVVQPQHHVIGRPNENLNDRKESGMFVIYIYIYNSMFIKCL